MDNLLQVGLPAVPPDGLADMLLGKSHTAIDYFFVGGAQKKKRAREREVFLFCVFQPLTEALKIVVLSAAGAGRLLDGTVGCGTMEGSVTGSAHLTGRMIKGLPSGPALLLTADMCFSLHWISPPCNHPSTLKAAFFSPTLARFRFSSRPGEKRGRCQDAWRTP